MHSRLTIRRALSLATAGVFLVGCGGGGSTSANPAPPDKQILRVNDRTEPNSYDPTQQTYSYEAGVGRQVFEALLKPKADGSDVQAAAAKSYDISSDGLTYTFHLQPNAKWSDGKPVTASDWVYGYQHLLNPALAAGYVDPYFDSVIAGATHWGDFSSKSSVKDIDGFVSGLGLSAPDPSTFVIKLDHPAGYFKWVVTLWLAAPIRKDVVEQAAGGAFPSNDPTKALMWANNAATIIGNGVFKISEIAPKDHVTLVPNPYYWGGPAKLQQVIEYFIEDGNTAYSKYQTGALDMIGVPLADVTVVRGDPKLSKQANLYPRLGTWWMVANAQRPPLDNPKVRMAFAKSIDRNSLVNNVLHGVGTPTLSYIPKGMAGYDESNKVQSFDPAAAKKLLADAGVTAADLNKFKLLTRNTTGNKTINQFIVDQWNTNLGLNIQLDVVDSKTTTSRYLRKGDFDLYGPDGWGADYPDQQDWFDNYTTGACHSLNWGCAKLDGFDELVKKADAGVDQAQRNKDYAAAHKIMIDQAAIGMLYQDAEYDLIQPWVANVKSTAIDDQFLVGSFYWHDVYITQH